MHKKILTSLIVIAAIIIAIWQIKGLPSMAEDLTSTVTVTGGGGNEEGESPDTPLTPGNVIISTVTAHPERRAGGEGTNYKARFLLSVLNPASRGILYRHPSLLESDSRGIYETPVNLPSVITQGTYDIALKTKSHLTKILNDVTLVAGNNNLNFTNETNSPINGPVYLVAGDINNLGPDPDDLCDDVINAVDLSVLLHQLGNSDTAHNNIANLNRDLTVDQADLNILLDNLDKIGDS